VPGIHFIRSGDRALLGKELDVLLSNQLHDDDYRLEDVYTDATCRLTLTRYPHYPVSVVDTPDCLIVLEGRLYGLSDNKVQADLKNLSESVFKDDDCTEESVGSWLLTHDGDFVVVMRHKQSGRWAFLNDALGRLPVYYHRRSNFECLSREIGLVTRLPESRTADLMSMAQYLLFGFPLGSRMLWNGVKRLAPATLMRWDTGQAEQSVINVFDFEKQSSSASVAVAAESLVEHFLSACKSRSDGNIHNLLSLSGGLDSRSVAAGFIKAGCDFKAATFGQSAEPPSAELRIAQQLAAGLKLDWEQIDLAAPGGRDVRAIFRLKDGLINSSQAYDVAYFAQLRTRYGRDLVHFSGDGGDKTLPCLRPELKFSTTRKLANYILERHRLMKIREVAKLTHLSVGDIIDELTILLDAYPETSFAGKYVHFIIYERAVHWLFEGEDRNRCAFWSCTPFYQHKFFVSAMTCPDKIKKGHLLYREFLRRLSPVATDIVDAGRGLALGDPAYARRIAVAVRAARHPKLVRLGNSLLHRGVSYPAEAAVVKCLRQEIQSEEVLGETFDKDTLRLLAEHPNRIGQTAMDNLLALSSTVIENIGENPSAEYLSDDEFV